MKISCVSDTVTVIELTEEEMKKYDFTFEQSDYSSPHTRRVLWSIIDEASKITGKNVEVNKGLEIDFLPDIKGGCLLIISQSALEETPTFYNTSAIVYESPDINSFLDFAKAAKNKCKSAESSFYYLDGNYRLIVDKASVFLCALASEFTLKAIDHIANADKTREAFNCLIDSGALEILGGLFPEK